CRQEEFSAGRGSPQRPSHGVHQRPAGAPETAMPGAICRCPAPSVPHHGTRARTSWPASHLPIGSGTVTILLTGDSITDCGRDRDDLTSLGAGYAALVAAGLPEEQVINTGIGGNRVKDLQARWDADVLAHSPAVLSASQRACR